MFRFRPSIAKPDVHAPATAAACSSAWLARWARQLWLLLILACSLAAPAHADSVHLSVFEVTRAEDGLMLDFSAKFELSPVVEDALQKGVPLVFSAQAIVLRDRWYWSDKRINTVRRTWRLSYQPLTRKYRVTFGGLSQNHDTLADALGNLNSSARWKLADPSQVTESGIYIEFSYELDTAQLPRPMQVGIGMAGQADWALRVTRVQRLP